MVATKIKRLALVALAALALALGGLAAGPDDAAAGFRDPNDGGAGDGVLR